LSAIARDGDLGDVASAGVKSPRPAGARHLEAGRRSVDLRQSGVPCRHANEWARPRAL
jgi:hypothetical protein